MRRKPSAKRKAHKKNKKNKTTTFNNNLWCTVLTFITQHVQYNFFYKELYKLRLSCALAYNHLFVCLKYMNHYNKLNLQRLNDHVLKFNYSLYRRMVWFIKQQLAAIQNKRESELRKAHYYKYHTIDYTKKNNKELTRQFLYNINVYIHVIISYTKLMKYYSNYSYLFNHWKLQVT